MDMEKNVIKNPEDHHAIIVAGDSLHKINARPELKMKFIDQAEKM
jgi:hypothetical protein